MQPELPWNVAGIAPEARDAARASARREGLSVGEWLTRRILRSLTEAKTESEEWWPSVATASRPATTQRPPATEPAEMPPRIGRGENETLTSARRLEEHVNSLARRLEQTERSQSENSRTMSQAATDIDIVTREHAQAFEKLGVQVGRLDGRLARIEEQTSADSAKEAIKALHLGLSRLADQIADTAARSAAQTAQLADNMESLVGKLAESRDEGQQSWRALEERMEALAGNIGSVAGKLLESRDSAERMYRAVEGRVSVLEQAVSGMESLQTDRGADAAEIGRQSAALTEISASVDALSSRFTAAERESAAGVARLESRLAKAEKTESETILPRLESIERSSADLALHHDRDRARLSESLQDDLRRFGSRLDAAEERQSKAMGEMAALVKEISHRIESDRAAAAAPPRTAEASSASRFGLPPFAETRSEPFRTAASPPGDSSFAGKSSQGADPRTSGIFETDSAGETTKAGAGVEAFLAAARLNARQSQARQNTAGGVFSWVDPPSTGAKNRKTWIVLVAALAGLVIAAAAAGILLGQNLTAPPRPAAVPATRVHAPAVVRHAPTAIRPTPSPAAAAPPTATATPVENLPAPQPTARHAHVAQLRAIAPRPHEARLRSASTPPTSAPAQKAAPASPEDRLAALANGGNAGAEEVLGLQLVDGQGQPVNEAEGAKWLERAALQGEAVAAWRLGAMYERGQGVPADAARAVAWYTAAAKAGNRKAMHNLAVAYAHGAGVQKDLAAAAQWFARAAALGLADSQFNLAVMYERGLGVPQSLADAYKWYSIAAAQGDAESKARLDVLGSQIGAGDKAAAEKAAANFRPDPVNATANAAPDLSIASGGALQSP